MQISWNAPWYYIGGERSLARCCPIFTPRSAKTAKRHFRKKKPKREVIRFDRVLGASRINESRFARVPAVNLRVANATWLPSICYPRSSPARCRNDGTMPKISWKCQLASFPHFLSRERASDLDAEFTRPLCIPMNINRMQLLNANWNSNSDRFVIPFPALLRQNCLDVRLHSHASVYISACEFDLEFVWLIASSSIIEIFQIKHSSS